MPKLFSFCLISSYPLNRCSIWYIVEKEEERAAATILNKSLMLGKEEIQNGQRNSASIIKIIEDSIKSEKLARIDYVEIVDSSSLEKVEEINKSVLVAIAVFIGKTRLIDNFTYEL